MTRALREGEIVATPMRVDTVRDGNVLLTAVSERATSTMTGDLWVSQDDCARPLASDLADLLGDYEDMVENLTQAYADQIALASASDKQVRAYLHGQLEKAKDVVHDLQTLLGLVRVADPDEEETP